ATDPYLALLEYRSTPLQNGYSPAELLYGRRLRGLLPIIPKQLQPMLVDHQQLQRFENARHANIERNYNRRHGSRELEALEVGTQVWVKDLKREGEVVRIDKSPRSYWVRCGGRELRRNRRFLTKLGQKMVTTSTPPFAT